MSDLEAGARESCATVVMCTFNPHRERLGRALRALREQTTAVDAWELIIVDNNSVPPVADWLDVSWHPRARIVREERQGLTHARMKGIAEARAPLLIFVDDDNLLAPTYIGEAVRIGGAYGFLGAWGGGCSGEFETPPPRWLLPHLSFVAVKECTELVWSNEYFHDRSTPIGAGLCLRKAVADRYVATVADDDVRRLLDRRGSVLAGCGDLDMAMTAIDMGLGVGRFPSLQLIHVIPGGRMTEAYILRMAEESQASSLVLRRIRGRPIRPYLSGSLLRRAFMWLRLWTLPRMDRRIRFALMRGYAKGDAVSACLSSAVEPS